IHTVCVVAEGLVEHRPLTDRSIDDDRKFRAILWENVRLHRHEQVFGSIRKCPQDGLAADHHDLTDVGIASGRADDVLKLIASHGWKSASGFRFAPTRSKDRQTGSIA
ncbi:MAG: hypothetical protein ACK55I_27070, partial [bacterium]